MAVIALPAPL